MYVVLYPESLIETLEGLPTEGYLLELLGEVLDPHPIELHAGPAVVWIGHRPRWPIEPENPCASHLLAERVGRPSPVRGVAVVCGWDPTSGAALPLDGDQVAELLAPHQR